MSRNIISIKSLSKVFPRKIICRNESFGIHEREKIGLLGINGCGKSTFLKMLVGKEPADKGEIIRRGGIRINYLPQIPALYPKLSIYEQLYYSSKPEFVLLRRYYHLLEKIRSGKLQPGDPEYRKLLDEMDAKDVWQIEIRAKSFLTRLGFDDLSRKTAILSGGQKRRIDLARVLMDEPDVLILDEPTNHLDIETIEWLQHYLTDYKGIIIFVTHDRYFLDAISTRIMEIEDGRIRFYEGNYSYYLKQKEAEQADKERKETRRKTQLRKEMKWLQRGAKARTSKPKNHLDRIKELIDKSYLSSQAELDISFQNRRLGKTILEINAVSKAYGEPLFKDFSHIFQKNERIGMIGANGCGKTTLLNLIVEQEKPDSGKIKKGLNTHFAYFRQDSGQFNENISVLDYIKEVAANIRTANGDLHSASEMLQRFLFDKKMQQNKIGSLSGGEKKRLYLLRSLMFGSNFIILDEPTNDLDIRTLEILEDYLDAFRGCILIVSHDRYFLDRVTDYLFIFEEDRIIKFPGNYSDYLLVKRYRDEEKRITAQNIKIIPSEKKRNTQKLTFNEKRELEKIEAEIPDIERRKQELERKIEAEAAGLTRVDFQDISSELTKLEEKIDYLSNRWLELAEKK